ncbi:hypothetical protein PHAVU_009G217301 [Phaseolus vulgaris]
MGWKGSVCVGLFLSLNLLSLSIVTSQPCPDLSTCLSDLVSLSLGGVPTEPPCCGILQGLGGRAGGCLCDALRSAIPGITSDSLFIFFGINGTLSSCGLPDSGQCA